MIRSSAPGKIFLFGEHAVVYGEPAVAAAVDLRATVTVEERDDDSVRVSAPDLGINSASLPLQKLGRGHPDHPELDYVFRSVAEMDVSLGVDVTVESEVPVGSGLGSSAAVTVATIHALARFTGRELSRGEVARRARSVEVDVQGAASPTDTHVSAHGGANIVHPDRNSHESVALPDVEFVAGDTGQRGSTAELVENVRVLKDRHDTITDIIHAMGRLTEEGADALERGDTDAVGELMNVNHGLLEALGVSTPLLARLVHAAREAGSPGAKITGSGGGGCMVALDASGVADAIAESGGRAIPLEPDTEGVRAE